MSSDAEIRLNGPLELAFDDQQDPEFGNLFLSRPARYNATIHFDVKDRGLLRMPHSLGTIPHGGILDWENVTTELIYDPPGKILLDLSGMEDSG